MTDREINVAIHEARGLDVMSDGWIPSYNDPDNRGMALVAEHLPVPDYCHDLNAMHEAEDVLASDSIRCAITDYELLIEKRSTARQRAEAFLRTVGKWKETAV